jgi:hypothetical protein
MVFWSAAPDAAGCAATHNAPLPIGNWKSGAITPTIV